MKILDPQLASIDIKAFVRDPLKETIKCSPESVSGKDIKDRFDAVLNS